MASEWLTPAERTEETSDAEARLLLRLLQLFGAKRPAESGGDGDAEEQAALEEQELQEEEEGGADKSTELALIDALLALPLAAQEGVVRSLFAAPASLVDDFAQVLQFFMRVIMAAHSAGHERRRAADDSASSSSSSSSSSDGEENQRACAWERNGYITCIEYEQEERADEDPEAASESIAFRFPADVYACLAANYGSVKRLKCEEVWHGDHMAYRCRTCGLSDSSCMCLGCFDPDEHEGHDYRVYRCSSGGCCDCGDPLAWKPDGFCKKHQQNHSGARLVDRPLDELEGRVVEDLVRSTVRFCAEVMREVYLLCLRPMGSGTYDSDPFGATVLRSLPKAGRRRGSFSTAVQGHLKRLEQSLAWLQMLSMSCMHYRNIVSRSFFKPLPASFQLEPTIRVSGSYSRSSSSSTGVANYSIPEEQATDSEASDEQEEEEDADQLVALDVFLKAGVLLPVDMCDVLGVLYLKLLFDHDFKQKYTCHFVNWYPYFIEVYLKASDESNEDGMRNLSRFIDRLFCQLFHSTAQLRELEAVLAQSHTTARLRRRQLETNLRADASCVEWLMVFLLEKLNALFQGTMRSAIVQWRPGGAAVSLAATGGGLSRSSSDAPVVQAIHVVDCSRNAFKKRIYARLCSDLRTLLVHAEITAQSILSSFRTLGDTCELYKASLYSKLIHTFELLQQMDLQQRHVLQHVEYESQNWTFAFVADYELKLLLGAFLSGIPSCFSPDVWAASECGKPGSDIVAAESRLNPMQKDTFQPSALACALLQPLRSALSSWSRRNGCPEWTPGEAEETSSGPEKLKSLVSFYEQGTFTTSAAAGRINTKSFHLPLHHMYASTAYALSRVVHPESAPKWFEMLGVHNGDAEEHCKDLAFWYAAVDHPLRVLLFSREIKAGMWVRNGNVMLQQLTHYHSKHWRYYGLHADVFICQLAAMVIPEGSFTRVLMRQFPLTIVDLLSLRLRNDGDTDTSSQAEESKVDHEITAVREAASNKEERASRQQLELAEDMFRLVQQLVLTPVKISYATLGSEGAVRLLEREMRHWLSLGPFSRSDVISRTDMKLLEQIKQSSGHEWAELEDEEILSKVLDAVGDYEEPATKRKLSGAGLASGGGSSLLGFGLKMTGTWKLKPELWTRVSPLFECFTPSEAQLCEQNIRKYRPKGSDKRGALVLPVLPSSATKDGDDAMAHVLAERILNSDNLLSVMLVLLESFKRDRTRERDERSEGTASGPKVNDSLLLEALNVLYVGVQLLEPDSDVDTSHTDDFTDDSATDAESEPWSVNMVAKRYQRATDFFGKLCVEVPTSGVDGASVLSILHGLQRQKSGVDDVDAMAELIVGEAAIKSRACRRYVESLNRQASSPADSMGVDGHGKGCEGLKGSDDSGQDSKQQAREMMRKRQQMILEKMRSQQMQFLSSRGEASDASKANGPAATDVQSDGNASGSNNDGESEAEDEEDEEEEEEEDEWGFPTGHVDVNIYLDHISSALTAMCEHSRLVGGGGASCKTRRRRSLRRNSLSVDPGSSLHPRSGLSRRGSEITEEPEEEEEAEECGLCRLPCDPRSVESSFGLVGMILPSKLAQKMAPTTNGNKSSEYFKSAPALRVLLPGSNEAARLQLNDAVVWSCGHAIHHACLKSYLVSLWKQKAHRAAFEFVSGDERLLCERDMEFVCPICRRLSNCLVPSVSASLAPFQRTPSRVSRSIGSAGSFDLVELEDEKEETKDSEHGDADMDTPDPVAFLPWLDSQMSFRDDCPQVKRRRSRAMSSLIMRQPSLSSASSSSNSENERNVTLERAIGAFCHEIVLLSARAQLHLPLLMKGTSGDDDESAVEVELQQIGSEVGAQTPAWHLLLRCLEVQVGIVLREKQLLGGDDAVVDKWQLKSMRQVAQVAVVAAAVSAHSSLAWTVIDAPSDKRFELFMAKLNGVLFGQQVLFEEKDDDDGTSKDSSSASDRSIYGDWIDEVLVGTPLLAHPNLFACYMMRLVWKLCGMRTRRDARSRSQDDAEEMAREAYYSARVLVTAKILQALCCARLHADAVDAENSARSGDVEVQDKPIDDFDAVESLKDAYSWTSRLLTRTRLARSPTPADSTSDKWDAVTVEEVVGRVCLPFVQQVLLLMEVMLPLAGLSTDSQAGSSCGPSTAPCAVCDGLYPDPSASTAPGAMAELDRSLRKLHLPPLRLFFHRQTFPAGQRALCQLWGAQLESKAAVCRRAQSRSSLASLLSPKALWSALSPVSRASEAPSLDLRAHMQQLVARDVPARRERLLIDLPRVYMDLFMRFNRKPEGLCPTCQQLPQHPGLCLLCGAIVCCFSGCCEVPTGGDGDGSTGGVGECTQHAQACGAGTGAFLLLRACTVVLFLGNERRCVWGSLYVDKNGEEDPYLRRGKALFLDPARQLALETLLVSHAYSQHTAILANTSRRDGRRY